MTLAVLAIVFMGVLSAPGVAGAISVPAVEVSERTTGCFYTSYGGRTCRTVTTYRLDIPSCDKYAPGNGGSAADVVFELAGETWRSLGGTAYVEGISWAQCHRTVVRYS